MGGGISTFVQELAVGLSRRGNSVTVISRSDGIDTIRREETSEFVLWRVPSEDKQLVAVSPQFRFAEFGSYLYSGQVLSLIEELEERNGTFDVIEFGDWGGEGFCTICKKPARCIVRCFTPSFVSESFNTWNPPFLSEFTKKLEAAAILESRWLISNSPTLMKKIENYVGRRLDYSLQEIPIDFKTIETRNFEAVSFSASRPMRILAAGRVEQRKGIDLILEVARRLSARSVPVQIDFAGSATQMVGGEDSISHLSRNIPENFRFLRHVPRNELQRSYAAYDLFVLPSRFESFGYVASEAIAASVPVVLSDAATISSHLRHNESALIFSNEDVASFEAAILQVYNNYQMALRMADAAKKQLDLVCSPDTLIPQYYQLYQRILAEEEERNVAGF
jgi:glycosyltransferase involved in cell wall biosynthesis